MFQVRYPDFQQAPGTCSDGILISPRNGKKLRVLARRLRLGSQQTLTTSLSSNEKKVWQSLRGRTSQSSASAVWWQKSQLQFRTMARCGLKS
ncbi:hypothetical protein BV898_17167 [Hypsibius exemplaris]|uniref:Uncharacterized protein n=1 Tax=Hypsibius exemplaris TaxID=2072580 RepID=A0A9X6NLT4_HYPEX|nr:hypothetical protein BV898_17167 [Hypsibius exemplaris]